MDDQGKGYMANEETGNELQRIIEIGWRRKWVIIVPFVSIFTLVTLWAFHQPNLFRSSSSIFIEPQGVPSDYVRPTVTSNLENRVRSINQRIGSRTKLLAVIKKLDLYPEAVKEGVTSDELVDDMREDLTVEGPTRIDRNFFIVHFIHEDPKKAMLAVSSLISLFIEESLEVREIQAEGTTAFIEEELEKLKLLLEKQEKAVQKYKKRYMGELPDQLEANLRMLDNLQLHISSNQESQRELDSRLMLIEQEMSRLEGELEVTSAILEDGEAAPVTSSTFNQLLAQRDALRADIANMESMYTSLHPDLVAARRELDRVEQRFNSARRELPQAQQSAAAELVDQTPAYSMELINLRRQRTEIKPRLSSLRQEEQNLRRQIKQYQKRVESSPLREQQVSQLTRDYENTTISYEGLLTKRLEAQMSENLEKRQQGEKFQILDPANLAEKPFLPNRPLLLAIGFAGGLGGGIGLALLLEALFPAFYSLRQLQQQVPDVPIAFAIPFIKSEKERLNMWQRVILLGNGWSKAILLLFISVVATAVGLLFIDNYLSDLTSVVNVISFNIRGML
jgi:polysaccharide chain length determinant protein (PEP-CTERM system associated)